MKKDFQILLLFVFIVSSCGKSKDITTSSPSVQEQVSENLSPNDAEAIKISFALLEASESSCENGGTMIATFEDFNQNNVLDEGENVLSESVVCNGSNGQDGSNGISAGIDIAAAPVSSCPAGGSIFKAFSDTNSNSILDSGENVNSITTVCNGVDGSDGSDGSNGQDGTSAYLNVAQATLAQCPAGGSVYTSSQSNQNSPDVTIVCNGVDGNNGNDANFQIGAVGSMVPNKAYSACHHDYLFIPNSLDSNRGWLTFRHQGNGSLDQGIGNTGFQVWNVDIPNFSLASEKGNVTYCSLNWNAQTQLLNYTVISNNDGLSGEQGSIDLSEQLLYCLAPEGRG